jgi:hypothetical protein
MNPCSRVIAGALLLAGASLAQTIVFSPQPTSRIPGLSEYRVYVSALEGQPMQVKAMQIIVEGLHQNVRIYSYASLQNYVATANKRSIPHYIEIGLEVVGWTVTAAQASDFLKIKESWKAVFPLVTGAMTLTRTIMDREHRPVETPNDLMQPLIAVPAGGAVDFAVFAQ